MFFFPIPVGNSTTVFRFPYITVSIIVINVLVHFGACSTRISEMDHIQGELTRFEDTRTRFLSENTRTLAPLADDGRSVPDGYNDAFSPEETQAYRELVDSDELFESITHETGDYRNNPMLTVEQKRTLAEMERALYSAFTNRFDYRFGLVPAAISGVGLFTHMFLHGGFLHLFGNMLFLWLSGANIEENLGRIFFPIFYVAGGVFAAFSHVVFSWDSMAPLIGASGAIAACMGAYLIRHYDSRVKFLVIYGILFFIRTLTFWIPAYVVLPLWFIFQVWDAAEYGSGAGIAFWAHIGGFLFGAGAMAVVRTMGWDETYIQESMDRRDGAHTVPEGYQDGVRLLAEGNPDGALAAFARSLTEVSNYVPSLTEMYNIFWERNDQTNTIRAAERLATQYIKKGHAVDALAMYRAVKDRYPDTVFGPALQVRIASLLAEDKQFRDAARAYRDFALRYAEHAQAPRAFLSAAQILLTNLNEPQNAVAVLNHVLQTYPDTPLRPDIARTMREAEQAAAVGFQ